MFLVGTKVKFGHNYGPKNHRGVITKVGFDGSWYNIMTNKGREHKLVPFNQIESREGGWQKS